MKNKHVWTVLVLWLIAILVTFFLLQDKSVFSHLAPVYFVCMLGSVLAVRKSQSSR